MGYLSAPFRPLRPIVYCRRTPRRFARRGPRLCIVSPLKFSRKDPAGFFVRISRGRTPNFCWAGQGIHFLLAGLLPLLRFLWFLATMWRCDTSGAHSFDGRFGYQAPAYSCCAASLQYRISALLYIGTVQLRDIFCFGVWRIGDCCEPTLVLMSVHNSHAQNTGRA